MRQLVSTSAATMSLPPSAILLMLLHSWRQAWNMSLNWIYAVLSRFDKALNTQFRLAEEKYLRCSIMAPMASRVRSRICRATY
ncbi:UNVERIFIED_CONTAM: hypothetical protein GTU68_025356 [Idotea baltica]|nr:hypothetical protein [Idotea baltica]